MIQALGLDGEEADIFRKAAGISHVPDPLRKDLAATARTIADLQRQVETAHMARRVAHAERHALKTRPASEILKASGLDPDAYERAVLAPDRSLDSLPALAAAFGVDLAFLLTGQPAPDWYKSGGFSAHS